MNSDLVIWNTINPRRKGNMCSFKAKTLQETFCRNPYNVTGLCQRASCPLANGQYATIVEQEGVCYLYLKTIERAHSPAKLWEKIKLSKDMMQSLQQVDTEMQYWDKWQRMKCKQRLVRIFQVLKRMRKLKLSVRPTLERIHQKEERQLQKREAKALKAAKLEQTIEKELLERLRSGTYGDIYNFPSKNFDAILDEEEVEDATDDEEEEKEGEEDEEFEDEDEEEEEEEFDENDDGFGGREFVEADDDDILDMEDYGDDFDADEDEDAAVKRWAQEADDSEDDEEEVPEDDEDAADIAALSKTVHVPASAGAKRKTAASSAAASSSSAKSRPAKVAKKPEIKKRRPHVEIELEEERESSLQH